MLVQKQWRKLGWGGYGYGYGLGGYGYGYGLGGVGTKIDIEDTIS